MATAEQTYLRTELEQRRERLHEALHSPAADASLSQLLTAVDTALSRIDQGTFGLCEECHDTIEAERLLADPLVAVLSRPPYGAPNSAPWRVIFPWPHASSALSCRSPDWRQLAGTCATTIRPAGMVSGDYCDLFETDGGLLFMLGDVSGKGVAASMLMSHLHATFRSLAEAGLPLDRMVEDANRIFCESTLAGQFATLVVGRAAHDGSVEFVSAGHLPVLHIHGDGATPKDSTGCLWGCSVTPASLFIGSHWLTGTLCSYIPTV